MSPTRQPPTIDPLLVRAARDGGITYDVKQLDGVQRKMLSLTGDAVQGDESPTVSASGQSDAPPRVARVSEVFPAAWVEAPPAKEPEWP